MERPDLSNELVHFIRGETASDAFLTLKKILREKRVIGGNGYIRGGYRCVCFCEAPVQAVADAMDRRAETGIRYQPFGIVLPKDYIFSQGGRPVIYQTDAEYDRLPEDMRWRHVRYEPDAEPPIDFTWEREWRVRTDQIELDPAIARIVLPHRDHVRYLIHKHDAQQDYQVELYGLIMESDIAEMYREAFPWRVDVIEELKVVPPGKRPNNA